MPLEVERKFLVNGTGWREGRATRIRQGYLTTDPARSVRVRLAGDRAWLTIKGAADGATRAEYEYPIPAGQAAELLDNLCLAPLIEKIRYRVEHAGLLWEVDEFLGENEGLVLAEVELSDPGQAVEMPDWVGAEVTGDERYYNQTLAVRPYRAWSSG